MRCKLPRCCWSMILALHFQLWWNEKYAKQNCINLRTACKVMNPVWNSSCPDTYQFLYRLFSSLRIFQHLLISNWDLRDTPGQQSEKRERERERGGGEREREMGGEEATEWGLERTIYKLFFRYIFLFLPKNKLPSICKCCSARFLRSTLKNFTSPTSTLLCRHLK